MNLGELNCEKCGCLSCPPLLNCSHWESVAVLLKQSSTQKSFGDNQKEYRLCLFVDTFKISHSNKSRACFRGEESCSRRKVFLAQFLKSPQTEQFMEEKKNWVRLREQVDRGFVTLQRRVTQKTNRTTSLQCFERQL